MFKYIAMAYGLIATGVYLMLHTEDSSDTKLNIVGAAVWPAVLFFPLDNDDDDYGETIKAQFFDDDTKALIESFGEDLQVAISDFCRAFGLTEDGELKELDGGS